MLNSTTKPFKHYIITRFNVGLYNSKRDHDRWMQHRMTLFTNITLPSIMAQTCQNFTWLILVDVKTPQVDVKTPQKYCDLLNAFNYKNLRLIYFDGEWTDKKRISATLLRHIKPGNYDLLTTRLDNDDALNCETIKKIQYWYTPRPDSWMITFPIGVSIDLRTYEIFPMEYLFNPFPTLIENSINAKTVEAWPHYDIGVEVKEFIVGNFFWLQVIHSKNIINNIEGKVKSNLMKDKPLELKILKKFNIDYDKLLKIDFDPKTSKPHTTAS